MKKVLFVASECAPIAKVGGLGDVIGTLPRALRQLGLDVKVVIPFYEVVKRRRWKPKLFLRMDKETVVYKTRLPKSLVEVFLIYNRRYLSRGPIYGSRSAFVDSVGEVDRFVFFSKTVWRIINDECWDWKPDIIHCHDWHTGALIGMLRNQKSRTVFTIHNLANQGIWRGQNLMAEGIENADLVTTVSPAYAKEILTKDYGEGLEKILRKRHKEGRLEGVLNGIDYDFWPCPSKPWRRRTQNKFPHFGFVARLTYQKGLSLLLPLVSKIVEKYNAKFWFLGQGEKSFEDQLKQLAEEYPDNVFVKIGFDEKLARKIYSESDFFLMPSLFEPSGLGQMISMHYGSIPIVRKTGGLKDTVEHLKTGFVFSQLTSAALFKMLTQAIEFFFYKRKQLEVIRRNCLREDFSWLKSAKEYLKVYNRLIKA